MEKSMTCMILEDVPLNAEVLKDSLKETNRFSEMITFSLIESAKDYFRNGNALPDIIFLDLYFSSPREKDYEHALMDFLEEFDDVLGEVNICVVSASHQTRDMEKVKTYKNIIGFIEKPITKDKLEEILKKI